MLEIVDHTFSIEKVHGRPEKVPIQRPREPEALSLTWNVRDSDDLLERDNLEPGNDRYDIKVAGQQGYEETANHNQSPDGSCDEVGLFLLVL